MDSTDKTHAGADRLALLDRDHRRAFGKVYTSPALAEFTLRQAVPADERLAGPVLDPSVGAGVFLVACVQRMALDHDLSAPDGRADFVQRVRDDIWGIDVDEGAVELARKAISAAVERVTHVTVDPDTFEDNVVLGDFLCDGLTRFKSLDRKPILVLGNPPYVPADRISAEQKADFRNRFTTAHGRLDLYTLFMEQAVRVVEPGGAFAFITPDKYLSSVSASKLRALLRAEGDVRSLGVFSSHRVFEDAATVPCVTVWRSHHPSSRPQALVAIHRLSLNSDPDRTPRVDESQLIEPARLAEPSWSFQRTVHQPLDVTLTRDHRTLGEVTRRISAGLTTGYNPAFVLDAHTAAKLEPELLHPTVRGRDVTAHHIIDRGEQMLVPYVWDSAGVPTLIDLDDYPQAKRWLRRHRARLEQRHCVRVWGKSWWDLHDPVGEPLHAAPKVLVPDVARSNRFATDAGKYIPQHSVYYLSTSEDLTSPISVETLTAILNSRPVEFLVRSRAPVVKDGFSRYRRQFLVDLPVPEVDADTQDAIRDALVDGRDDDVAELTCALFGVAVDEVDQAISTLDESRIRGPRVTAGAGRVPPKGGAASS